MVTQSWRRYIATRHRPLSRSRNVMQHSWILSRAENATLVARSGDYG